MLEELVAPMWEAAGWGGGKGGLCACPPTPFHPPKLSLDMQGGHQLQSPGVNGGRGNGQFGPPKGPGHQEYPACRGQRAQGQALARGWKTLSHGLAKRPPGNETQGVGSSVCEKRSPPARGDHTSAGGCPDPAAPVCSPLCPSQGPCALSALSENSLGAVSLSYGLPREVTSAGSVLQLLPSPPPQEGAGGSIL